MSDRESELTPAPPAHGRGRGRQDGITCMTGTVNFSGSSVSINLQIAPDGGSQNGTSGFRAGGAPGLMVPASAISKSAEWTDETPSELSCTALPKAVFGSDYSVAVQYTLNNASRTLSGVVRGTRVVQDASATLTLS